MKVGDLVKAIPSAYGEVSAPIVGEQWVGIIIGFTCDYQDSQQAIVMKGSQPIVYWNPEFSSEIELAHQIMVIHESW